MTMDRRGFIALAAATAAAPALAASRDAFDDMIVVNALGGLGDPNRPVDGLVPEMTARIIDDARMSGVTAVNITLGYISGPADPFEASVRDIAAADALFRDHVGEFVRVFDAEGIWHAKADGRIGVIYCFQNGAMLGRDAKRVDIFADLGVRIFQLTYNPANALGDGAMAPGNRGLTAFGREVVARLNERRMIIDLSHSGERTCLDAVQASKDPVSINHTGCRALTDLPRNKTDAELRLVAERGGFIGIYFMPFLNPTGHATAEDVVAHIDHAVNICGQDHVGIGTDGDISQIDDLAAYRSVLAAEIAKRQAAGISAAGERPDTYPFVVDLRGPEQFRKLVGLLRAKGYNSGRIEKIMGDNFLRFASDVWGR